jgi:hypothetical protein
MLLKIFKHDFKTCARYEVPILFALLGATVLGIVDIMIFGSSVNAMNADSESILAGIGTIVGGLGWMFVYWAICITSSIMAFMIYYRFYKSMITDEAYLTLTLPVKPRTLITGKLLSSLLWMLIAGVACAAALILVFGGMIYYESAEIFIPSYQDWAEIGVTPLTGVILAVTGVVMAVSSTLQVFFAILFAGSIVKKYKALCAIGLVIGINSIVSTVMTVLTVVGGALILSALPMDALSEAQTVGLVFNVMLGVLCLLSAILGVVFFCISCHLVKHKVNLE